MVSGCALLIDYVLTITLSVASGADAVFSFLPASWQPWRLCVAIAGVVLLIMTKIPYLSITPTFSICKTHGYIKGEHFECPECGAPSEVFTRIVGYYRPVSLWNKGKQAEYAERLTYGEIC